MPSITGATLIGKAKLIALDPANIRWTDAEWLSFLNDGQKALVVIKPRASVKVASQALVYGTKQTIPTDGIAFLEVTRNMGGNGTTPGLAPRPVERARLDAQMPTWNAATATAVVTNYMGDPADPRIFRVYPPSDASAQVEVEYVALPAELPTAASVISLENVYGVPLIDYMLYRAYLKDIEFSGNAERALFHLKQFESQLGKV